MDIYKFNGLMAALSSATSQMASLGREFSELNVVSRLANDLFMDSMMDEIYGKSPTGICYKIHTGRTAGIPINCKAIESIVNFGGRVWRETDSSLLLNKINIESLIRYKNSSDESHSPRTIYYTIPICKSSARSLEEVRVQVNLNDLSAKITFNTSLAAIDISYIGAYRAEVKLPLHERPIPVYLSGEWLDAAVTLPVLTELGYTEDSKLQFNECVVLEHYYKTPGSTLEDHPKVYKLSNLLNQLGNDPYSLPMVRITPSFCKDIELQFSMKNSWTRPTVDYIVEMSWADSQIVLLSVIPKDRSDVRNYNNNFILNKDISDNMDELVEQAVVEIERLLEERSKK